ncbi:S9 family peptidase [Gordonia sp. X0973]|uniref:prolyl oligopeptidase family serine peptidase n=1 Tax=Gordonia sp. X0973 TaxID=2742602 RepID=UPI000F52BDCD|nr:prolyl oligopeptidase family serine peptidase [Gordonia sp. X0973]QKT06160.1 S9 family peptidase [Gordonia sp. X0973]
MSAATDPNEWLEDVEGGEQLAWVREKNRRALETLATTPRFAKIRDQTLAILDSDDKIPPVRRRGEYLYNFWVDAKNPLGLWRRTTLESYRTDSPEWDVLIDVDALAAADGVKWVWHGAAVLRPRDGSTDRRHVLVSLSREGADATVVREFDLVTREWVKPQDGGFALAEAKSSVGWIDADTVLVSTDFGTAPDGGPSMTESGYPRIAKRWVRGTDLADAPVVFAGEVTDVSAGASYDSTPGFERIFASRSTDFYNSLIYQVGPDGELALLDVPTDAHAAPYRQWLFVMPRSPWALGGSTYEPGSLLVFDYAAYLAGNRDVTVLFTPDASTSLADYDFTKSHLILTTLHDVVTRVSLLTLGDWQPASLPGLPELATIGIVDTDPEDSDEIFASASTFTTPPTLFYGTSTDGVTPIKHSPAFFDATDVVAEQRFTTSDDGTRIPYFVLRRRDVESGPTLLYGYGGFQNALVPGYSPGPGLNWVSEGGIYVIANIRGGGEYGPTWHTQTQKAGRHKVYEDFSSVAKTLVADGMTTVAQLGAMGGSNGGLLMGVMATRYPELFGALVCQVPLIDMRRFHKLLAGASWVAEYGNPDDPEQWAFMEPFSPYHNVRADLQYPAILITTSTRDDRVHPGHARKFAAKLEQTGHDDVWYYENIEGGHGGAADNKQSAFLAALAYEFLWQQLGSPE